MCGIFGQFSRSGEVDRHALAEMRACLRHRGPDADGIAAEGPVGIGNVRLSIIDLTDASNQPIHAEDGAVALVQNGEIYNYVELRDELHAAGVQFATKGDTEVLLKAYQHWGEGFVARLNGMFTIAIHDRRSQRLLLYRDRLGVKPLFLSETRDGWLFASEIKALLAAGVPATPDIDAFAQFFALGYVPPPATAFARVRHLMPGHMAVFDKAGMRVSAWWTLDGVSEDTAMTEAEAAERLLSLLDDATRLRLRADAGFGAFLSGGLDSSSVVGCMARHLDTPVRSFALGFDDARFDESPFAEMAARRFGTTHRTKIVQPDLTHLWPRFIYHCDQPHQDVSFMAIDMVSDLAAREVKMVLTGDGGDELFAGYEKYLAPFPEGSVAHLTSGWERAYVTGAGLLQGDEADRLLAGDLRAAFRDTLPYRAMTDAMEGQPNRDPINRALYADTTVLLPGNNLVKPDRMAMANSLEVRSPFLDYRMVEFAFTVPGHMKLAGGETKAIYKTAVRTLLGDELTYRRKQMFTVPIGEWFRDALAEYCREILLDGRLAARGLFDIATVEAMLDQHIAGTANYTRQLRALIAVETWFRLFQDRDADILAEAGAA